MRHPLPAWTAKIQALLPCRGIRAGLLRSTAALAAACALLLSATADARTHTFEASGYKLLFQDDGPSLPTETRRRLAKTFFTVYPVLTKTYNPEAPAEVHLWIDPDYTGIAEAGGNRIRINPQWMIDHPEDIDIITHEAMHLVQRYPHRTGPGWITEGIADYARHTHGVNNEAGRWSLPNFTPTHSYTSSYRVTARFLVWIETKIRKGFVARLDDAMRNRQYRDQFWKYATGRTLEELWTAYAADPSLK